MPIVANVVGYHVLKPGFVNGNGCEVIQAAMLREHLSRVLPPVISPTFLVRLDALPLTPNWKSIVRRSPRRTTTIV